MGEALAKAFVAGGGHAILSGRNVGELERVASESGFRERCLILPFDTMDFGAIPAKVTGPCVVFQPLQRAFGCLIGRFILLRSLKVDFAQGSDGSGTGR